MVKTGLIVPLRLCFFMWVVFAIEYFLRIDLGYLGIYPRHISGLVGVVMAPLLHGNFNHIASNSVPLLVLGGTLFFFYRRIAFRVFLQSYFFTNILVWFFGRPFYHIGASGLIYALASFLVFYGFFSRDFKTVIVSFATIFFYGSMAYGLFSFDSRVSWESHLLGAVVGAVTAYMISKQNRNN